MILLALVILALAGCAQNVRRGMVIRAYQWEQLQIGKSTYNDVLTALGTPTSVSSYDPRLWYYFNQSKSQWGFLDPQLDDQEIYQVQLDDKGTYLGYKKFTGRDAVSFSVSKKTTPTVARDKSFFQELLSNFGRYGGTNQPGVNNPVQSPLNFGR
ncbi:MAG: outer membrane protein assembly factor BamE [Alphaproteobacteria bacterium]|nr:outer membrane protein assembly factor BamE [Alphaproteobacteria bacterium]